MSLEHIETLCAAYAKRRDLLHERLTALQADLNEAKRRHLKEIKRCTLLAAEPESQLQSVLCLDRTSGAKLWSTVVHRGHFVSGGNKRSTHASATPACDGERVYITFLNDGRIYCSALSVTGDLLWQQEIDDFVIHQGYGASPTIYGPLVLVAADHKGGGAIAGLDRISGEIVWKQERPATANYTRRVSRPGCSCGRWSAPATKTLRPGRD